MDEWLHNLPVWWMAFVVFAIAYLAAGGIFVIIMALAKGERVRVFKSVSLSLLAPLGTIFGLLVAFSAVQAWNDMDRAKVAVDREASAIWVKWTCLFAQAGCTLIAIAMVHCDNRAAAAIAMGIFATGVAVSVLLIVSHDRPFSGEISVKPDVLLQVRPE